MEGGDRCDAGALKGVSTLPQSLPPQREGLQAQAYRKHTRIGCLQLKMDTRAAGHPTCAAGNADMELQQWV